MTFLARMLQVLAVASLLAAPRVAIAGPIVISRDLQFGSSLAESALVLPPFAGGAAGDADRVRATPVDAAASASGEREQLRRLTHIDPRSVIQSVPEPSSVWLIVTGLGAALARRRRAAAA